MISSKESKEFWEEVTTHSSKSTGKGQGGGGQEEWVGHFIVPTRFMAYTLFNHPSSMDDVVIFAQKDHMHCAYCRVRLSDGALRAIGTRFLISSKGHMVFHHASICNDCPPLPASHSQMAAEIDLFTKWYEPEEQQRCMILDDREMDIIDRNIELVWGSIVQNVGRRTIIENIKCDPCIVVAWITGWLNTRKMEICGEIARVYNLCGVCENPSPFIVCQQCRCVARFCSVQCQEEHQCCCAALLDSPLWIIGETWSL